MSKSNSVSLSDSIYQSTNTPYLPILNTTMLLVTPWWKPQLCGINKMINDPIKTNTAIRDKNWYTMLTNMVKKPPIHASNVDSLSAIRFTRGNLYMFSLANLLGSWMILDNDLNHGSGFICAWNVLYVWANGTKSMKWIAKGQLWPLGLTFMATLQSFYFGRRFLSNKINGTDKNFE